MVISLLSCLCCPGALLSAKIHVYFRTLTTEWTGHAGLPFLDLVNWKE